MTDLTPTIRITDPAHRKTWDRIAHEAYEKGEIKDLAQAFQIANDIDADPSAFGADDAWFLFDCYEKLMADRLRNSFNYNHVKLADRVSSKFPEARAVYEAKQISFADESDKRRFVKEMKEAYESGRARDYLTAMQLAMSVDQNSDVVGPADAAYFFEQLDELKEDRVRNPFSYNHVKLLDRVQSGLQDAQVLYQVKLRPIEAQALSTLTGK